MHRRALALLTLFAVATFAFAACGNGNTTGPVISDPKEIVTKAVEAMQKATTVHLDATVDGTLKPDLLGGGSIGDITLDGTTFSADVDLANKNLHMKAGVPAMLGLTADIIVIGADTYTKISLAGDKYQKSTTSSTATADPLAAIVQLKAFLDRPEVSATKKDDAPCGSRTCYVVAFDLTAEELRTLVPGTDLGDATIGVSIQVERDTLHPAAVSLAAKGSTVGDLTLKVTLSAWDKPVTVSAPPADQVQ